MTDHGVHLHRAVRSSELIDGLATLLSDDPLDPFRTEVVGVPTPGVERWLAQALSQRLGVAAGIDFPTVAPWLGRMWAQASADLLPDGAEHDPWRPDRLTWSLLDEIDRTRDESWASALSAHLDADALGGRRYLVASRIARLWHRYSRERPELIASWLTGGATDGPGAPLPARHAWQAELWRRVRARIGVPSPAERIDHVVHALRTDPARIDLPERLSLFGLNRLDALDRTLLQELARHRSVHLWLAHPSPGRWRRGLDDVAPDLWPRRGPYHQARSGLGHRLVSALGRDVVEFQHVVTHLDVPLATDELVLPRNEPGDRSLLTALQSVLADDHQPDGPTVVLGPDDHSIQVHSCHGPDRQVEVLREVICTLLADDPELEPRDIIVMTPDLPRFAPLVGAAFDPSGGTTVPEDDGLHPGRRLRVRIADQSLTQVNPVLAVVSRLLDLVHGRLTASDLVDLCAAPPIASRFRFSSDDLERIEALVRRSGVRWGVDATDRGRFGLGDFPQNTVGAGLDRMVLGVAWSEAGHQHLGLVLPLDEVESSDVDLVGRLAEFVDRLRRVLTALAGPHPLAEWVSELQGAVDLLCAAEPGESWQIGHAWSVLHRLLGDEPGAHGVTDDVGLPRPGDAPLDLGDVRALLATELAGRPSRANFRTGALTLSSLAPMRSVPHKVICLLGMDDQAFPRGRSVDGDDILAARPRVGDRDPRSEDRQLFLDALMAAEQAFVVVHTGRDPRTNATRPPAIPVGELLDAVDALAATPDGGPVRAQLVVEHPLQPYDPRNFTPTARIRSFDSTALTAAVASTRERARQPPVFTRSAVPPPSPGDAADTGRVALADLQRFFKHPAKAYARDRAGWIPPGDEEVADDAIPLALNGLQAWQIGDRLLSARLAGASESDLVAAEWRRGVLPPRALGSQALEKVLHEVEQIHGRAQRWRDQARREVDLSVEGDGWAVSGTSTRVYGQRIVSVGYSWSSATQWQEVWWELLALTCTQPEIAWQAVALGKGSHVVVLGPLGESFAHQVLGDAVALRAAGLQAPLPLPPKAACSYVQQLQRGRSIDQALDKAGAGWKHENDELWQRFWGPQFSDLLAEPAVPDEQRGPDADPSRFGTLARRAYLPMLLRSEGIR